QEQQGVRDALGRPALQHVALVGPGLLVSDRSEPAYLHPSRLRLVEAARGDPGLQNPGVVAADRGFYAPGVIVGPAGDGPDELGPPVMHSHAVIGRVSGR